LGEIALDLDFSDRFATECGVSILGKQAHLLGRGDGEFGQIKFGPPHLRCTRVES